MSDNYVSNFEERYYEVHPSQLRWAMSQLGATPGYNVQGYAPAQNGMCIIVVQVPAGTAQQDWRDAPPRRRRWNLPRLARGLTLALIAVALAYIAYTIFAGAALDMPAQGVAIAVPPMPQEMPWDAAGRQVSEAVEGATRVLMAGFVAIVLAIVAWVALKARGLWKMVRK